MDFSSVTNNIMQQAQMAGRQNFSTIALDIAALEGDDVALWNAAVEFESYFLQMMFREMRSTVNTDRGILPESRGEQIFRDMLDEQHAITAARTGGGVGLAQQIFRQMSAQSVGVALSIPDASAGVYGNVLNADHEQE